MARIITCDRCGARVHKGETIGHISVWNEDNGETYQAQALFTDWDICPDCMGDIYAAIKTPILHEGKEAPEDDDSGDVQEDEPADKPKAKRRHKKVDADMRVLSDEEKAAVLEERRRKAEQESEELGPDAVRQGNPARVPDWGKFRACIEAGKNNEWLAVEFSASVSTVKRWKQRLKAMDEAEQTK